MSVNPVPDGYRSVIPYLIVDDAAAAIDFYVEVFRGEEVMRMPKDGKIGHAEIRSGGCPKWSPRPKRPEVGDQTVRPLRRTKFSPSSA